MQSKEGEAMGGRAAKFPPSAPPYNALLWESSRHSLLPALHKQTPILC